MKLELYNYLSIAKRSWDLSNKKLLIGYLLALLFLSITNFVNNIISFRVINMLGSSTSIDSLFQSIIMMFTFFFIYDVADTINGMIIQNLGTRLTYHFNKTYYEHIIKNLAVNPDYYWLDELDKTEMYNSIKKSSESLKSIWSNMFGLVEKSLRLIFYTVTMIYMLFQKVDIFNKWTIPLFLIPTLMFIFKKSMINEIKDSKELVNKLNSKNISVFNMIDNKFIHGQIRSVGKIINVRPGRNINNKHQEMCYILNISQRFLIGAVADHGKESAVDRGRRGEKM